MSWWQKLKHELGRESQPVDTVIRLIVLERAIRGGVALVLGIALLAGSKQIVHLVRFWASELNETIGHARRRRWAEYLIVIAGGLGIPFEVHEVIARITVLRVGILAANVAIVIYLAVKKRLFVGEPQTSPPPSGGVGEASSA